MHHSTPASATKDAIDLSDEVWSLEHIATYLNQSVKAVRRLVAQPEFPNPLFCQHRNRRWLRQLVVEHLKEMSSGAVHTPYQTPLDVDYVPRSISLKEKRAVA